MNQGCGVLLLFLSKLSNDPKEGKYIDQDGKSYLGTETNDAPVKYLLQRADKDGIQIQKVLCITSEEVLKNKNERQETAFQVFCKMVRDTIKNPDVLIQGIPYKKDFYFESFHDMYNSKEIYETLSKELNTGNISKVYIDYTGGMRDVSFLMTTIVRYLEFKGIQCAAIVYSLYEKGKDGRIIDITYVYDIFRMINAVNDFVSYGNSTKLREFSKLRINGADELFFELKRFSDSMTLCSTENIDEIIKNVDRQLARFEMEEVSQDAKGDDLFRSMLKTLIPTIREKLYMDKMVTTQNGKSMIVYPWLIKWCADNGLMQQAFTVYVEKMPLYYAEKGYLEYDPSKQDFYQGFEEPGFLTQADDPYSWLSKLIKGIVEDCVALNGSAFLQSTIRKLDKEIKLSKEVISTLNGGKQGVYKRIEDLERQFAKKKINNISPVIFKKNVEQKDFISFMRYVINGGNKDDVFEYRDYLLFNKKYEHECIKKGDTDKLETYKKKIELIEQIQNGIKVINSSVVHVDKDKLCNMMRYYLSVKLIRNTWNHAGDNQKDTSRDDTAAKLKNTGVPLASDVEGMYNMLQVILKDEL